MVKRHEEQTAQIIKLLGNDTRQPGKNLANKLGVNRTFLASYLKALESQGYVKSKKIGLANVCFKGDVRRWLNGSTNTKRIPFSGKTET
ncbi:MAG: HTH domain-containing protein [Candidatus Jordarchaeaceae archaeon]